MAGEAFFILPVSLLIGFSVFAQLVRSRWGGDWLWLETWGDRLGFFFWPRPPINIVKLVLLNGEPVLLYNQEVRERKHNVQIHTPLGIVTAPEKASIVLPLTAVYLPGVPSPMTLVVYALAGLITSWLTFYYGYLFLGFEPDAVFATLAFIIIVYIYMYYNAASSNGVEYHSYEVRGVAPPFLHAVPSSEVTSPLKTAKYNNTPIIIRVKSVARDALEEVKRALGVDDVSQAAELLAAAEFYNIIIQKATSLKVKATRVEETFGAFRSLELRLGRITVGRVAFMLFIFIVGLLIGLALGGSIIVGPPEQVIHNATNASMGGGP